MDTSIEKLQIESWKLGGQTIFRKLRKRGYGYIYMASIRNYAWGDAFVRVDGRAFYRGPWKEIRASQYPKAAAAIENAENFKVGEQVL